MEVEDLTYTPNTTKVDPAKVQRVIEAVPRLLVWFKCPRCDAVFVRDAYRGVPRCRGDAKDGTIPRHVPTVAKGLRLAD